MKNHIAIIAVLLASLTAMGFPSETVTSKDSIRIQKSVRPQKKAKLFVNPPVLTATGNQIYCPGTSMKIVTDMTITSDPGDTSTSAVYIQISSGYVNGEDLLSLSGSHPNMIASWDSAEGKLTLVSPFSANILYSDFVNAIKDVLYTNNSASPFGVKTFSISIGKANYLPSTGHYYEFVSALGITWSAARTAAENRNYFGLQGYLATIGAADEAQLSGEQAAGAGWIGGSDAQIEGIWKWVTGPEAGTVFWNGETNGSTPNFAFWNTSEPNNLGNENYAHITAPGVGIPGSWNDLSNEGGDSGDYQPKGYIVEYGGLPGDPILNISTSTTITIPGITDIGDDARCGNGSVSLTATSNIGTIKWYDAPVGGNLVNTGTSFTTPNLTTTTYYYLDPSEPGCTTITRTMIAATINDFPVVTASDPAPECEGNITLTATTTVGQIRWFANETDINPLVIGNTYNLTLNEDRTFYLDAINQGCVSGAKIPMHVTIVKRPVVNDEAYPICENGTLTLDAGISNVTYEWTPGAATTKQITIDDPGTYTVKVSNGSNCSSVKTFTITEKFAPVISEISIKGTTVTILTTQPGDFEYSVDGIHYQESNVFNVPHPGINTAYVKETNFCGQTSEDFVMIIVPLYFTPNSDSHNDELMISGMNLFPKAKMSIYDRYGKLVCELNRNSYSWNGDIDGNPLPASDYWYVLKIDDTTPIRKGHFSLIR